MSNQHRKKISELYAISLPLCVGTACSLVVSTTDTYFLSLLGSSALASVSIAVAIYLVCTQLVASLASGHRILSARAHAIGDVLGVKEYCAQSVLVMVVSAVLLLIMLYAGQHYVYLFSSDPIVVSQVLDYLMYRAPSLIILAFTMNFSASISITKATRLILYAAMFVGAINVLFDYLFIFGSAVTPQMGVAGAGLASTLATCCGCVASVYYVRKLSLMPALSHFYPSLQIQRKLASLNCYESINAIFDYAGNLVFIYAVALLGSGALAVSQVATKAMDYLFIVSMAFASGAQILLSRSISTQARHDVECAGRIYGIIVVMSIALLGGGIFAMGGWIAPLFFKNADSALQLKYSLYIIAMMSVFVAGSSYCMGVLRAYKRTRAVMLINLCSVWGVQIPIVYCLIQYTSLGVYAVFIAFSAYFFVKTIVGIFVIRQVQSVNECL